MPHWLCQLRGHQRTPVVFATNRFYCRRCGLGLDPDPTPEPEPPPAPAPAAAAGRPSPTPARERPRRAAGVSNRSLDARR